MSKPEPFRPIAAAIAALVCGFAAGPAAAVTLYDASSGSFPSDPSQGWLTAASGGAAGAQSVAGGLYTLDTTGLGVSGYGSGRTSPVALDTGAGFDLVFTLRVQSEMHTDSARSGYSVIVVGANPHQEIELAFWGTDVWVYDYSGGFVHGSTDAAYDTTSALHTYTLSVRSQQFTLASDGTALLSGAMRDYTASGLFPYVLPNALFFGDDSARGSSITQLGTIALTTVPEPAAAALWLGGLALLARRVGRRCLAAAD